MKPGHDTTKEVVDGIPPEISPLESRLSLGTSIRPVFMRTWLMLFKGANSEIINVTEDKRVEL